MCRNPVAAVAITIAMHRTPVLLDALWSNQLLYGNPGCVGVATAAIVVTACYYCTIQRYRFDAICFDQLLPVTGDYNKIK